jgi:hypothetical protein
MASQPQYPGYIHAWSFPVNTGAGAFGPQQLGPVPDGQTPYGPQGAMGNPYNYMPESSISGDNPHNSLMDYITPQQVDGMPYHNGFVSLFSGPITKYLLPALGLIILFKANKKHHWI